MKIRKNLKAERPLNVMVPLAIFNAFSRRCLEFGITKTAAINHYLEYLAKREGWEIDSAKFLHKGTNADEDKDYELER